MTLKVQIITPERSLEPVEADQVVLPAHDGEVGVRTGHAPYVFLLGSGELRIDSGTQANTAYALRGGVAQVQDNTVYVLAESVTNTEEVSESDLVARLKELDDQEFDDGIAKAKAKTEANWIVTQLKTAGKEVPDTKNI